MRGLALRLPCNLEAAIVEVGLGICGAVENK